MSIDKRDVPAGFGSQRSFVAFSGSVEQEKERHVRPDRQREGARHDDREGYIISIYPDYCWVGSKIIPFNLVARLSEAENTAISVGFTGQRVVHKGTVIAHCYGDEASDGGGIHSGTVGGLVGH